MYFHRQIRQTGGARRLLMDIENSPMGRNCGANNPMYGHKHTEETIKKISKAAKKRFSDPSNHPNWKGGRRINHNWLHRSKNARTSKSKRKRICF